MNIRVGITVFKNNITEELKNKDFTINSLCYDIIKCELVRNIYTKRAMLDL